MCTAACVCFKSIDSTPHTNPSPDTLSTSAYPFLMHHLTILQGDHAHDAPVAAFRNSISDFANHACCTPAGYALECAEAGINVLLYDWKDSYPWSKLPQGKDHPLITVVRDWSEVEAAVGTLSLSSCSSSELGL